MKPEILQKEIIDTALCEGCGACGYVCPDGVIHTEFKEKAGVYRAVVYLNKINPCRDCGLCLQVCPALKKKLASPVLVAAPLLDAANHGWLIGPFENVYLGHAKEERIRFFGSSGGMATSTLIHLLDTRQIDGVLMPLPDPDNPSRHQFGYVETASEVYQNRGSVYCHVNLSTIWKLLERGKKRLAVVGLPCHLTAIDQMMRMKKWNQSDLFKIGLFCGGTSSHKALGFLLKRKGVIPEKVERIRYRSGGWPGRKIMATMRSSSDNRMGHKVVLLDKSKSILQSNLYRFCFAGNFFPKFCLFCKDQTAEAADISLGDAWLPEVTSSDNCGTNIIISRTKHCEAILGEMTRCGKIQIQNTSPTDVLRSQKNSLMGKKMGTWAEHLQTAAIKHCELIDIPPEILQYIPGKGIRLEKRIFRKMTDMVPHSISFYCFIVYHVLLSMLMRLNKIGNR